MPWPAARAETQATLRDDMADLQKRPAEIKKQEQVIELRLAELEPQLEDLLLRVPQPPDEGVPIGKDDEGVEAVNFGFEPAA